MKLVFNLRNLQLALNEFEREIYLLTTQQKCKCVSLIVRPYILVCQNGH